MSRQSEADAVLSDDQITSPSVVFTSFEQALKEVGAFGRYQITYLIVLQVAVVVFCGNFVFLPYSTYEPTVTCHFNGTSVQHFPDQNQSQEELFCSIYEQNGCDNLTFAAPLYTIVEEWELICSKQYAAGLVNTITVCGIIVAGVAGYLSDRFGRKRIFLISYIALIVMSIGSSFAWNWIAFALIRFTAGFFLQASYTLFYVWGMEQTDQKHNFLVNLGTLWQFAYMITALLAYLTKDYRMYLIVLNSIGAPLIIAFGWYFVESPRWLVQHGRLDKAAKLLNKIGDRNGVKNRSIISEQSLSGIPQHEVSDTKADFLTLLKTAVFRKYLLTLFLVTFSTATAISAFVFKVSFLPGNPFYKFFIYGLLRLVIPTVLYFADKKSWFGRRHIVCLTLSAEALIFGIGIIVQYVDGHSPLLFVSLIVGAIVSNFVWTGTAQYQVELFPTHLRNMATSAVNMVEPSAAAIMPQILYLESQLHTPGISLIWTEFWIGLALVVAYLVLPETKGRPLPDKKLSRNFRKIMRRRGRVLGAAIERRRSQMKPMRL